MSYKIFDLKNTSIEEARFIKNHLRMHRIKFYETPEGRISHPAIWVKTAQQEYKAKKVIEKCQKKWNKTIEIEPPQSRSILNKKTLLLIFLVAIALLLTLFSRLL